MSSRRPRIAVGGIIHETHTFAEPVTGLDQFAAQSLYRGSAVVEALQGTSSGLGGMLAGCADAEFELIPTLYAAAMPSGMVSAAAYCTLRDELLAALAAVAPLDGVLLALHGAMVAENERDVEGDLLARIRALLGPQIPLVVELDMHGNISPRSVAHADVLLAFHTNPHIDPYERGAEAAAIMARMLRGDLQPTAAIAQAPVLLAPQATGTADLPLRAVHARAAELRSDPRVVAICVMAGFAYADTPDTGASMIVTTDDAPECAQRYADELAALLMAQREAALPLLYPPAAAIQRALALPGGPIILVDSADNIGGGTPGDGTDALRALLAADVPESAVVIADREAVAACWAAGAGAELVVRVGGKVDRWHGEPVQVRGVVRTLCDGTFRCELQANHFAAFYGDSIRMGRTVWLRVGGVNVVLTERKTPPFDLAQLRGVGIIPESQKLIVVKSAVAYRAAYLPIAAGVVEMDTAGLCSANLQRFPYQYLRRPIFPLDTIA
ncbi:MAG: M81 family metallopeptidase [Oscillochloris sp.]|nr:M81 family metallopeptidase [Oscillochloris sp.]